MGNASDSLKQDQDEDVVFFLNESASSPLPGYVVGDFSVPLVHKKRIYCLKYDSSRNILWSGSLDKTICGWNVRNGKCVHCLCGHTSVVTCLDIDLEDPSSTLYSCSFDRNIFGWNIRTGKIVRKFSPSPNWITCIVTCHSLLFSAGYDNAIYVHRISNSQRLSELRGHTMRIEDLKANSSEGLLYSSSLDGTVREWDIDSCSCTRIFSNVRSGLVNIFHVRRRHCFQMGLDCGGGTGRERLYCMSGEEEVSCWAIERGNPPSPKTPGSGSGSGSGGVEEEGETSSPESGGAGGEGTADGGVDESDDDDEFSDRKIRRGLWTRRRKRGRRRGRRRDKRTKYPLTTMRLSSFDVKGDILAGWNFSASALEIWDLKDHSLVVALPQPIIKTSNVCLASDLSAAYITAGPKILKVDLSRHVRRRRKRAARGGVVTGSGSGSGSVVDQSHESFHLKHSHLLYYFIQVVGLDPAKVIEVIHDMDVAGVLDAVPHVDDRVLAVEDVLSKRDDVIFPPGMATARKHAAPPSEIPADVPPTPSAVVEEVAAAEADWLSLVDFEVLLGGPVPPNPFTADELALPLEKKSECFLRHIVGESRDLQPTVLVVRREQLVFDACKHFGLLGNEDFRKPMYVFFANEAGLDTGGVSREFYHLLCEQILDLGHALFIRTSANTYHPNPSSAVNQAHYQYFEFIGKLVGKAFYDMQMLDLHFSPVIFKLICGRSIMFEDLRVVDPVLYSSLIQLLEMENVEALDLRFCVDVNDFGQNETTQLVEGGEDQVVTDSNKHEFVRRYAQWVLIDSVRPQLEHMLNGLYDVIPRANFLVFDETELELTMCGSQDLRLVDWVEQTSYEGFDENSPGVKLFWDTIETRMNEVERSRLLQFVTGTACVPVEGFRALSPPFSICRLLGATSDYLPVAHTCLNRLEIPVYESCDQCYRKVIQALTLGKTFEVV